MYTKVIKKYYLYKIFTLSLPTIQTNVSCYYLCKYLLHNTPYGNLQTFVYEMKVLTCVLKQNFHLTKNVIFLCTNKIFLMHFGKYNSEKLTFFTIKNYVSCLTKKISCSFFYNMYHYNKYTAFFKSQKIMSIGFISPNNQPNNTDYTFLIETKFFSSIFLFHFILKKLL